MNEAALLAPIDPPVVSNAPTAPAVRFDAGQLQLMRDVLCPDATAPEIQLFAEYARRTGLDPFARQIYLIVQKAKENSPRKVSMAASIDGLRLIAERTGHYAGQRGPFWTGDGTAWVDVWVSDKPPLAAKVAVLRHDFAEPLWAVAALRDYTQRNYMWSTKPALMLGKCVEGLALRRAFPAELSGVYGEEEMGQVVEGQVAPGAAPPPALATPGDQADPDTIATVSRVLGLLRADEVAWQAVEKLCRREDVPWPVTPAWIKRTGVETLVDLLTKLCDVAQTYEVDLSGATS